MDRSGGKVRAQNFDLHLNNGRLLEHFHEGNLTYRVKGIQEETPDTFVEISPELAQERNAAKRHLAVARFSLWPGSRARAGHGSCQRTRTVYADEFHRKPRESADQQQHRSSDSHAGLQRNQRAHENPAR